MRSEVLYPYRKKMTELVFIMEGIFALTNKKRLNPTHYYRPFLLLPRYTIYGDYQILFDLYTDFDFRTYVPIPAEQDLLDKLRRKSNVKDEKIRSNVTDEDIEPEGEYVIM